MFSSKLAHFNQKYLALFQLRVTAVIFLFCIGVFSVYAASNMNVKQFEWVPSVVKVGRPTTFYWNIENAVSCFGNNKPRTASGNNGRHVYDAPKSHTTSWYCTDKNGQKIYLTAPLRVEAWPVIPSRPGRPSVRVNGNDVSFSWGSSTDVDFYQSMRRINGASWSHATKHYGRSFTLSNQEPGTYSLIVRACTNQGECSSFSSASSTVSVQAPAMRVKQFEWKPAIVETGKPTTFYWNVENAQSCFGNNKTRTAAGNNGVHI
ncbi:MAG: hypothetical protein GY928_35580, partial [Colwellia sp.]|nr:hypothetical protein [Colwellia sp.]